MAARFDANGAAQTFAVGEADAETRFEIGSITKLFTSLLLADMVLAGEVALDDPVTDYLPDGALAQAPGITLRMLARHRSGLPGLPYNMFVGGSAFAPDQANPYSEFDEAAFLEWVEGVEPDAEPEAEFAYSNAGFALLGQALARAAGQPYETLLIERIVRPMQLGQTDFQKDGLVTAYANGDVTPPWDLAMLAPAGALVSTLEDMIAFGRIIADPTERWERHVAMIAADPVAAMGQAEIGLGLIQVDVGQQTFWLHNGGTGGFSTSLWVEPGTGRGAVVLLNSMDERSEPIAMWMLRRTRS
ncbi:serine hydrolase domain-containing protein [Sphingomicrobium sp. XHP0239]|uniref:serine hydrolase domain-containing protein n=1 Tax=Sphingomicrobium maritimum TaxID=3133972 RepID=UPI0031CC599B